MFLRPYDKSLPSISHTPNLQFHYSNELTKKQVFVFSNKLIIQVQAVTQSLWLCYAGCYARLFYVNKKRRKCYTETCYNASYKVVR